MSTSNAFPGSMQVWLGRFMSWLPAAFFIMGGVYGLIYSNDLKMAEGLAHVGWPAHYQRMIIFLEIACAVIYLIPYTSVLGAILLTGYLGGAIATHIRIGEFEIYMQVIMGVMIWGGLYLRIPALRTLIPFRR